MRTTASLFACSLALSTVASAQGPDCASATAIAGEGAHAFSTVGIAPSGFQGGATCNATFDPLYGDWFWQWTATTAGDYRFEIAGTTVSEIVVHEGSGCAAICRAKSRGYIHAAMVSDVQVGDAFLIQFGKHVNGPQSSPTLTIETVTSACSTTPDDVFEDNDTCPNAVAIAPGAYPGLFTWGADPDFYSVQVPDGDMLEVDWQPSGHEVALRVHDAGCGALATNLTGSWRWTNATGAPVTRILELGPSHASYPSCATYDLNVAVRDAPCLAGTDDPFEPNDSCASPAAIGAGTFVDLVVRDTDHDYWSILVPAGQRVTINGASHAASNEISVARFDGNCALVEEAVRMLSYSNRSASPETVVFRTRPNPFYGEHCKMHDMSVSLALDPCFGAADDAFEDNDTCATTAHLVDGSYPNLWIDRFDPDLYRTCVAPGGTLQADVVFADNVLALKARLRAECQGGALIGQTTIGFDLIRITYTNQTGLDQEVTLDVSLHPTVILSECGSYDLSITGSGGCATSVFCDPGGLNSAGGIAHLTGTLGTGVGSDLHLEAVHGPPGSFGYFLVSGGFVEPGGMLGEGELCLTNPVGRYNGGLGMAHNSIGAFDVAGVFQNLGGSSTSGSGFDVPSVVPLIGSVIQPGDTWHFQLWYRDSSAGAPTVNFTEGVSVTF